MQSLVGRHSRRLLAAITATTTLVIAGTMWQAFAADEGPALSLTVIEGDTIAIVGTDFPPEEEVVEITTKFGDEEDVQEVDIEADGRFAAIVLAPMNFNGNAVVTAVAGETDVDKTVKAGTYVPPSTTTTKAPGSTTTTKAPGSTTTTVAGNTTTTKPAGQTGRAWRIMALGASLVDGRDSDLNFQGHLFNQLTAAGHDVDMVGGQKSGPSSLQDRDDEGHSGWRNDQLAAQAKGWVTTYRPDIVLIASTGGNDTGGVGGQGAADRLKSMITEVYAGAPNAHVIVYRVTRYGSATNAEVQKYSALVPGIVDSFESAGKSVALADVTSVMNANDTYDGTHPNPSGQRKMAEVAFPLVEAVLQ